MLGVVASVLLTMASKSGVNQSSYPLNPPTAIPNKRQLAWHRMETYGFIHFGPNTFSGIEWGSGKEDPTIFNPTQLDCEQWVKAFKDGGFKGIIFTAKHHDGFCLWPSKFSRHTVAASPYKKDVLRQLSDACKKYGMKLGVYLSPWDRNHPTYGTEDYNDTFVGMLEEVLTGYGPIFEVWFDGANGEGPNGKKQVYDWNRFISTVRKHQPNAMIFSDAGPDVRWIGNEEGKAPTTHWSKVLGDRYVPGTPLYKELGEGSEKGTHWIPGECDVSIRPGWFWRESENAKVKSPEQLENLYFQSVGRGASFLLNVPPDRRGLIHENDVNALRGFRDRIQRNFKKRAGQSNSSKIEWSSNKLIDRVELREDIAKGQWVNSYEVWARVQGQMQLIAKGTTIGPKRLIRLSPIQTDRLEIKTKGTQFPVKVAAYESADAKSDFIHETEEQKDARMNWWREARFGMFIHWGLYSIPAGEWNGKKFGGASEWLLDMGKIPIQEWLPLQKQFNPTEFDAKKIVSTAKAAGMKYIVITSKHHEGFAIWPSKQGNWHIGNTSFKRDPLKELSDECRRQGIKFCTYHSILDWHHPDFLPRESWCGRPKEGADFEKYVAFMKAQLKEVISRYQPAVMWFDGEWKNTWNHQRGRDLYNFCRSLKPDLIINNRVDVGRDGMAGFSSEQAVGDFGTPEQEIPANGVNSDWESCMTMNGSWGFHANDTNWKSVETLIFNAVDCASKGGNYLLNVGPDSLGRIPQPSIDRLLKVGEWMQRNGEAVYGTQSSPFPRQLSWGKVTRKGKVLYATVFDRSASQILLPGLQSRVISVTALGSRERLDWEKTPRGIQVSLPARSEIEVYKITLDREPMIGEIIAEQNADGSYEFMAEDAMLRGNLRYESENSAIGFWTQVSNEVSWNFEVNRPGTYQLEVEYACDAGSSGSEVTLTFGGNKLKFVVQSTNGWGSFTKVRLPQFRLDQTGPTMFTVKADSMPKGAVMNLKRVRLIPTVQ